MLTSLALLLTLALAAEETPPLAAEGAWIRLAPPEARVQAGYVLLRNQGTVTLALVAAESAAFGAIEIHDMVEREGVMRMRRLERLEIPAAGSAELRPGGLHLMLFRPVRPLAEGESVTIRLRLADGRALELPFVVRAAPPAGG
ncbi:MAG: copper chaperone PCu(A)C [Xanthomonadales bacterium]|nr:copper chaperone PCu(A)C [Xanthomonadales bacterium]